MLGKFGENLHGFWGLDSQKSFQSNPTVGWQNTFGFKGFQKQKGTQKDPKSLSLLPSFLNNGR